MMSDDDADEITRPSDARCLQAGATLVRLSRFCLYEGWLDKAEAFAYAAEECLTWAGGSDVRVPPSQSDDLPNSWREIIEDARDDEPTERLQQRKKAEEDADDPEEDGSDGC